MLGAFQKTVVIVALVVLVVALIFIAIMLVVQANSQKFPPYSSSCPDYWNMEKTPGSDDSDGTEMCINSKSLGKINHSGCKQLDPNNSIFSGSSGGCNKYTYARACGITWDGITNNEKLRKTC